MARRHIPHCGHSMESYSPEMLAQIRAELAAERASYDINTFIPAHLSGNGNVGSSDAEKESERMILYRFCLERMSKLGSPEEQYDEKMRIYRAYSNYCKLGKPASSTFDPATALVLE